MAVKVKPCKFLEDKLSHVKLGDSYYPIAVYNDCAYM